MLSKGHFLFCCLLSLMCGCAAVPLCLSWPWERPLSLKKPVRYGITPLVLVFLQFVATTTTWIVSSQWKKCWLFSLPYTQSSLHLVKNNQIEVQYIDHSGQSMDLKETRQSDCNQTRAGEFRCTFVFMSEKVNVFQDGAKRRGRREAPEQKLMFGQWFSRLAELFWPKTQPSPQSRTIFSIFMVSVSSSNSLFRTGVRRLNLLVARVERSQSK